MNTYMMIYKFFRTEAIRAKTRRENFASTNVCPLDLGVTEVFFQKLKVECISRGVPREIAAFHAAKAGDPIRR